MPTQAKLEAGFDSDERDVAAGVTTPSEPILAKMRATAEHIRKERARKDAEANRPA